jgi:multimeric flavodoxin WrbA
MPTRKKQIMKRIIAINGSSNKHGRTNGLLSKLGIPIYHLQDGIAPAYKAILKAHVVVFATPTRWFNVSALMKQLIDAMEEGPNYPCEGKAAFFVTVCDEDGGQQAINQMIAPFNHMGFLIPPYASYIYNNNMAEKSEDKWMLKGMAELRSRLGLRPEQNIMGAFLCP